MRHHTGNFGVYVRLVKKLINQFVNYSWILEFSIESQKIFIELENKKLCWGRLTYKKKWLFLKV